MEMLRSDRAGISFLAGMCSAVQTQEHYASALERATGKSAQRIIQTQGQLRTFDRPAHELRLVHVRSERGHQAHMRHYGEFFAGAFLVK